jgi:hypothetical protein
MALHWKSALAGVALAALMSVSAQSQDGPGDVTAPPATQNELPAQSSEITPPREVQGRYVVMPHTMHCHDETHWDWMGSDETFFVFRDPVSQSAVKTATFGNVDSGDTRPFSQANGCVTPLANFLQGANNQAASWTCGTGVASISFIVEAYEDDDDDSLGTRSYYSYEDGPCTDAQSPANCNDDLIGRARVTHSAEELDRWLPQAGLSTHRTVRVGGYTFEYVIQRVADVVVDPPIEVQH